MVLGALPEWLSLLAASEIVDEGATDRMGGLLVA